MASRPALLAGSPVAVGCGDDLRRPARSPGGRDEPGRRPPVDSLARPAHPRATGGRQRLLPRLSLPAAAHPGPTLPADRLELAAAPPDQMAGRPPGRRLPVGLRGAVPVGSSAVDGVPGP